MRPPGPGRVRARAAGGAIAVGLLVLAACGAGDDGDDAAPTPASAEVTGAPVSTAAIPEPVIDTTVATTDEVTTSRPPDSTTTQPTIAVTLPTTGPPKPPGEPTDTFRPLTLDGAVQSAAEGCVELTTDVGRFALVGDLVADLAIGQLVTVVAVASPNASTTCEGIPMRVTEIM